MPSTAAKLAKLRRQQAWSRRNIAAGICADCTRPLKNKRYCVFHIKYHARIHNEWMARQMESGRCSNCRNKLAKKSKRYCETHLQYMREYRQRRKLKVS